MAITTRLQKQALTVTIKINQVLNLIVVTIVDCQRGEKVRAR